MNEKDIYVSNIMTHYLEKIKNISKVPEESQGMYSYIALLNILNPLVETIIKLSSDKKILENTVNEILKGNK